MGASPRAFAVVRGRGYRPDQVDRKVARLIERSRKDWERVAELTAFAEEMAQEAERLRAVAESCPPQTYESLGGKARKLLVLAEGEAEGVRAAGDAEARRTLEQAESTAGALRESARTEAGEVRAEAETVAARTVEAARSRADALRAEARTTAGEVRDAAGEALREVVRRCEESAAGQEKAQAQAWEEAQRELAERERALENHIGELEARGKRLLTEAKRERAEAEEAAQRWQEAASGQGDELLAAARVREEGVERETEGVLREHAEQAEEMRRHMARVRSTLASLTGRAASASQAEDADGVVSVPGQVRGQ
jgi:cell division septum initiation protein DivIVA